MSKFVILTGVSGAGKSTISHAFEERNFQIVENIPYEVFPSFLRTIDQNPLKFEKVECVVRLDDAAKIIPLVRADKLLETQVIVLDCSVPELRSRYRLSRHIHPLEAAGMTLEQAITHDKKTMGQVRPLADLYIDTTGLQSNDLRKTVFTSLDAEKGTKMAVVFASFGYKYGIPQDAEIVLDTRIVPNPFWVKGLKELTGLDRPVIDFLDAQPECPILFQKMCDYLDYYLPRLEKEGRSFVFVDIGCSGGQHRSVYFAEKLYQRYKKQYLCSINHRELPRYTKK
jgi:UPF0042 nucleotide-binding protein